MNRNKDKTEDKKWAKYAGIIIFLIVMIGMTIFLIPVIKMLPTEEGRTRLKDMVESYGAFGPLIFILLQVVQVVIAVIPGEPFEIIGGMLFGGFFGYVLCLAGVLIGTVFIYFLVKLIGQPLVSLFVNSEKLSKYKILNDEKRLETLVFILFFIPGTPKDALTYIVPLTKIKPSKYFLYSTLARTPSIISSTFVGTNIGKGHWGTGIIIFIVTAVVGFVGIKYNDAIIARFKQKTGKK